MVKRLITSGDTARRNSSDWSSRAAFWASRPSIFCVSPASNMACACSTSALQAAIGFDGNFGPRLPGALLGLGLVNVGAEMHGSLEWGGERSYGYLSAQRALANELVRTRVLGAGRLTEDELNRFVVLTADPSIGVIMDADGHRVGSAAHVSERTQSMSTIENKEIVRRMFDVIFHDRCPDRGDEFFTPDYLDHAALPGQPPGLDGAKHKWAMYLSGIPDLRTPIDDMVAEGDRVAVRFRVLGTHSNELLGIAATGKPLQASGTSILRLVDGRIAENWEEDDRLGLLQQLGAIPRMGPAEAQVVEPPTSERATTERTSSVSTDENKAVVRRFHDEVFNEGRLSRADELFTRSYVDHGTLPGQPPGLAGATQKWSAYLQAIGDLHLATEDLVAEDDRVAARWSFEGIHRGELLVIPPTGLSFHLGGISIYRLADGKIAEYWEQLDKLGFLLQVGAVSASVLSGAATA